MNSSVDTIAALATPIGDAGLAVVRISGDAAFTVGDRVFRPSGPRHRKPSNAETHTVHYGHIEHGGRIVDEVLLGVFQAPRTFTRENIVEITCHGGWWVARQVLDAVLAAGARLADPGEFTRRAFLNGRLDLAQAEAVADLIRARSTESLEAAQAQLQGRLSKNINALRDDLLNALAHLEAHIDFPDEDISPDTADALLSRLDRSLVEIRTLRATAREGRILRHGLQTAIVGRPNAGKSSLLNLLLEHDRAIVSPVAGTTRDTIEETTHLGGIPVVLIDTAGLRSTADDIERQGILRSETAARRADLILHVVDATEPWNEEDSRLLERWQDVPRIVVINKGDLPRQCLPPPAVRMSCIVSCITGDGFDGLRSTIVGMARPKSSGASRPEVAVNGRHDEALQRAEASLAHSVASLSAGAAPELVAFDLRTAVSAVGEIVGKTSTEDLLDRIFSQFCLGK